MDAVKLRIKTVIDNSGLSKGVAGLKAKIGEISEKVKGSKITQGIGNFVKGALSKVKDMLTTILSVVKKIGLAFITTFAAGVIGGAFKKAIEDSETIRGNLHYLLAMVQTGIQNIIIKLLPAVTRILEIIIDLIWKILNYINMITKAWFHIDLFKGTSETFAKNMKKAAGSAKQIKKNLDLAPFDEINKLSDNSSSGGAGGGGASYGTPTLNGMEDVPEPAWMSWLLKNGPLLGQILAGIATALVLVKLGLDPLKALGGGLIVTGLLRALEGILGYLKDPTWENFGKVVQGIGMVVAGVGLLIGNWIVVLVGGIILLAGIIAQNWNKITKTVEDFITTSKNMGAAVRKKYGDWIGDLYDGAVRLFERIWGRIKEYFEGFKQIFNGIIEFFKGVFTLDFEKIWNGLKDIVMGLYKVIEAGAKWVWDVIYTLMETSWLITKRTLIDPIVNLFKGLWDGLVNGAIKAWEGVKKVFSTLADFFKNTFKKAWEGVKAVFSVGGKIFDGIKEGIVKAFSTVVNAIIKGINKVVKVPFDALNTALKKIKKVDIAGVKPFNWISTLSVPQIPLIKLAKGGIINNPGRGVPLGSNIIGGEAGPEAVIPLNEETMNRLGAAIARNMVINANITNSMNGRVISRELQKIANESDFAFNR